MHWVFFVGPCVVRYWVGNIISSQLGWGFSLSIQPLDQGINKNFYHRKMLQEKIDSRDVEAVILSTASTSIASTAFASTNNKRENNC